MKKKHIISSSLRSRMCIVRRIANGQYSTESLNKEVVRGRLEKLVPFLWTSTVSSVYFCDTFTTLLCEWCVAYLSAPLKSEHFALRVGTTIAIYAQSLSQEMGQQDVNKSILNEWINESIYITLYNAHNSGVPWCQTKFGFHLESNG